MSKKKLIKPVQAMTNEELTRGMLKMQRQLDTLRNALIEVIDEADDLRQRLKRLETLDKYRLL